MSSWPPSGSLDTLTNDDLLYYIDMTLVGVLVFATLVYFPRTVVRYTNKSILREGWMLIQGRKHYVQSRLQSWTQDKELSTRPNTSSVVHPPNTSSSVDIYPPAPSTTAHINRTPTIKAHLLDSKKHSTSPTHIRSYTSRIPAIGRVLDYHVYGYRFRQLIIMLAYFIIICVAMFYASNPATNVSRAGFVVMSQMPIVFALGTKNSVITVLTGISYERLNLVHRWVGRLMFIAALFHFIGWLAMWSKSGTVAQAGKFLPPIAKYASHKVTVNRNIWGLVAFIALCFSALGSNPWFRAKLYTMFWYSHILGLFVFIIGVWKHQPTVAPPYLATCIALYATDQLARLAKTRFRKAILTPVPELDSTHVYLPRLDKGWTAGQHVRLRLLSFENGILGWSEVHPFTISNASDDVSGGLSLVCKRAGDWTSGLYRMASQKSKGDEYRSVYVLVEGPYGGPGKTVIPSFSGVMLVLGGSGITFGISVLEDIIAKSPSGTARALCVNFVWVVQHPSAVDPYLSTFIEIAQRVPSLKLTLSVFYTRGSDDALALRTHLPQNIQIRSGRPDLGKELEGTLCLTRASIDTSKSAKNGVIMAACGPGGMISSVYAAKNGASAEGQRAVGGLEVHAETFGW